MPQPDVLVVGGGAAALCAAITARRAGVSVLLLERAPAGERGGNSRHSRNFRYVHEGPSPFSAGPYPEAEFRCDLARVAGSDQDPALLRLLIERSTDLPDWLLGAGVQLQPVAGGGLPRSRKTAFLLGGGKTMLNALYATAVRLGVDIRYSASVESLFLGDGSVQAVHYRLQEPNQVARQDAGQEAREEAKQYPKSPCNSQLEQAQRFHQSSLIGEQGGPRAAEQAASQAGVKAAAQAGTQGAAQWAALSGRQGDLPLLQGSGSQERQRNGNLQIVHPGAIILCSGGAQADRAWLRTHCGACADGFINRGTPHATSSVLRNLLSQGVAAVGDPATAYLVAVDARSPADDGGIVTRVRSMHAGIVVDRHGQRHYDERADTASTRYAAWGQRLADFPGQIGYLILDRQGLQVEAPSFYPPISAPRIGGLAQQLGIPVAALEQTLDIYNAAVRPLEPPFFAYPVRPGITFTYHGVAVDASLRVCHQEHGPIDNLFAAGMLMAPNLLSRGYLSGLALMIGLATGRAAGEGARASAYKLALQHAPEASFEKPP